jgi:TrmH family RNA methyltransferase
MISSTRNPKIQWVRSLQSQPRVRREEAAFTAEGVRLVEEALFSSFETLLILYTGDTTTRKRDLLDEARRKGVPIEEVTPAVLKVASDTDTPQGILAVMGLQPLPLPHAPDFLVIVDGVHDPGNLGTLLRTASAAGAQAVLLSSGSVDPFSPKVVRSGMGAHFRLPVHPLPWDEIESYLREKFPVGSIYLADSSLGDPYFTADFRSPLSLIIGGEAEGAGQQAENLATRRVHIPMPGKAESLNAAVAASVLMFEVVRQRSGG